MAHAFQSLFVFVFVACSTNTAVVSKPAKYTGSDDVMGRQRY